MNEVSNSIFGRVTVIDGTPQSYEVRFAPEQSKELVLRYELSAGDVQEDILREVRQIFGLDNDLAAFYTFASQDEALKHVTIPLRGMRLSRAPNGFEMLASAICAQQVNRQFAEEVRAALIRRFGVAHARMSGKYAFPAPATIAAASPQEFEGLRLSKRKVDYLRAVAAAYVAGWFDDKRLLRGDLDAAVGHLTAISGIGRWTAEWYLLRVIGRPDICPISDLVVRKALASYYGDRPMESVVATWDGYASYATEYLISAYKRGLHRISGAEA